MVDRGVTRTTCTARHLIRRVSDDHVELHISSKYLSDLGLGIVRVNERVGVGFQSFTTVENGASGTAELAPVSHPRVLRALEPDVPIVAGEGLGDGVLAG